VAHGYRLDDVALLEVRLDVHGFVVADISDGEDHLAKPLLIMVGEVRWEFADQPHPVAGQEAISSRRLRALRFFDHLRQGSKPRDTVVVNQVPSDSEERSCLVPGEIAQGVERLRRNARGAGRCDLCSEREEDPLDEAL